MSQPDTENGYDWRKEIEGVSTPADSPAQSFPTLQWLSGVPGMAGTWREHGHFFIDSEQAVKCDWTVRELITKSGDTVSGFANRELVCSIIRSRRAWFVQSEGQTQRFPWDAYKAAAQIGNPRGKMQIIIAASGIAGYIALTLRGNMSKYAVERGGWGELARRYLYDPASKAFHGNKSGIIERLPSLCFSIGLAGGLTDSGKVRYITVGDGDKTSIITPIELIDPKEIVTEFSPYIVPKKIREEHESAFANAKEWSEAWNVKRETAEPASDYGNRETDVS